MIKISEVDKGRRVRAYITNGGEAIEYREGTFVGFADNGFPLIQYDGIKTTKTALPEWLHWEGEAKHES